ncbi:MAG: glutathione S-transferase family protein [Polyangiaceae bacterium]
MDVLLIGQFDSPFVRRVAIALTLYELPFEHKPWSVWANADELSQVNPLRRVPALVLDDGECLIESSAILDALDELVGPERALIARDGGERRRALRICALGTGINDKAVSWFYEKLLREQPSAVWTERCKQQIRDALRALEAERARAPGDWFGPRLGHADIAVACMWRFLHEVHPGAFDPAQSPHLLEHAERCEALPVFASIVQPFSVAISR